MKILNVSEAKSIVGGSSKQTCMDSYERITVNGVGTCKLITTCTDKHGNKTYKVKVNDNAGVCLQGNLNP